ncbi:MAG: sensor histidine kinase, partial [Microvirgula sp.]
LTGTVELFRCVQPSAAAMLQLDIDTDAGSRRLNVDPLQIEQVMLNLLQNAVEATRGCTDPAIRIHARVEADWLHVSVRDNGPGACEATLARLFEPFYTTRAQGLGLGLSICHSIIERHGGRVRAELADDSPGLVVTFTLPCTPDPA